MCVGTCRVIGREVVASVLVGCDPYAGTGRPAAVPAVLKTVR